MKQPQDWKDVLLSKFGTELFQVLEGILVFGSVFMIPDEISGIPSGKRKKGKAYEHPVVVIKYNKDTNQLVTCVVRTSNLRRHGVYTPAGVLPELDKDGIIVLDEPFKIDAQQFIGQNHLGILPEPYLSELKAKIIAKGWI